jgi:hypothetical protein
LSFDYDYSFKVKRQIRLKSGFDWFWKVLNKKNF